MNNFKEVGFFVTNHFMVYDEIKCSYDIYVFEKKESIKDLKMLVKKIKKENPKNWDLEMIEKEIRKQYKVKEVIYIDDLEENFIEVNKVGVDI